MASRELIANRKHAPHHLGRVLVLGLGKSGRAAVAYLLPLLDGRVEALAVAAGARSAASEEFAAEARAAGALVAFEDEAVGVLAAEAGGSFDLCIASPGISQFSAFYEAAAAVSAEVISEVEFAWRESAADSRWVAVTGTNGKTTACALAAHVLAGAGLAAAAVGNIGDPCIEAVAAGRTDVYVAEVSSYQLASTARFAPNVAVLLNITPDHLDRYDYCFQNYVDAKMRITQNQNSRDFFIYSGDDEVIWQQLPKYDLRMKQLPFAAKNAVASGAGDAFLLDGKFTATVGRESVEIDTAKMRIPGLHNAYNAMAAALAALAAGVSPIRIRSSIYDFAPVEHRLEPAGEIGGVAYINDSKATNVDSTWYALESMKRPVVWIAGGTDKGNDYEPLKRFAREKVHTLVCMGIDNRKLVESFTGIIPEIISTDSLDAAMQAARKASRPGDVVLLSPACASFDLFKNYENRGELFKQWVAEHAK